MIAKKRISLKFTILWHDSNSKAAYMLSFLSPLVFSRTKASLKHLQMFLGIIINWPFGHAMVEGF